MVLNILIIILQINTVFAVMNVNLTLIRSNTNNLTGNGLWLFCTADQKLKDVDWFKDNVRLDILPKGQASSNFTCPEDIAIANEICEIPYSHGYQLYVPDKHLKYTETWKCLAEPLVGYPVESEPKVYKANVCGNSELDVVFILDESGSVGGTNYQKLLSFTKTFLGHSVVDSGQWRVGMIEFSSLPEILFYLNSYTTLKDILIKMDSIVYYGGSTNTADALQTMYTDLFNIQNGDRENISNVAVLFTDGFSNTNKERTIPEATTAKAKGITIYTITINFSDNSEVKQIASDPFSKYGYAIGSFDDMEKHSAILFEAMFSDEICPVSIPSLTRLETQTGTSTITTSTITTSTITTSTITTPTTKSSTMKEVCKCFNETILSTEELTRRVEERRKRLKYIKDSSLIERRKYTSSSDDRYLATVIGYTSIALLSLVFLVVLTIDCIDIYRYRRRTIK